MLEKLGLTFKSLTATTNLTLFKRKHSVFFLQRQITVLFSITISKTENVHIFFLFLFN